MIFPRTRSSVLIPCLPVHTIKVEDLRIHGFCNPLKPLFFVFQDLIEQRFSSAKLEAGNTTKDVVLELHEEPLKPQRLRAEFLVIEPSGPVRITWNGIASLWAFAQGAARLSALHPASEWRICDGREEPRALAGALATSVRTPVGQGCHGHWTRRLGVLVARPEARRPANVAIRKVALSGQLR